MHLYEVIFLFLKVSILLDYALPICHLLFISYLEERKMLFSQTLQITFKISFFVSFAGKFYFYANVANLLFICIYHKNLQYKIQRYFKFQLESNYIYIYTK